MKKPPRLRYGLRFLLLLPVLVAAFYGGWTAHDRQLHRAYSLQEAAARQRCAALQREMEYKREVAAARLRSAIDKADHLKRMETFRLHSIGPDKARMFPAGRF